MNHKYDSRDRINILGVNILGVKCQKRPTQVSKETYGPIGKEQRRLSIVATM